jgi:hypothetical protein
MRYLQARERHEYSYSTCFWPHPTLMMYAACEFAYPATRAILIISNNPDRTHDIIDVFNLNKFMVI